MKFDQHARRKLSYDFVSPLENAMMRLGTNPRQSPTQDTGYSTFANYHNAASLTTPFLEDDDDEITEGSALLQQRSVVVSEKYQEGHFVFSWPVPSPAGRRRIPTEISTGGPVVASTSTSTSSSRRRSSPKPPRDGNHRPR